MNSDNERAFYGVVLALVVLVAITYAQDHLRNGSDAVSHWYHQAVAVVTHQNHPDVGQARKMLNRDLTVKPEESLKAHGSVPAYSRDQFGPAWYDADHNGCDTRNDILARDLADVARTGSCIVLRGTLHDPYTGQTISFVRGASTSSAVQIDHRVPLAEAWQSGADHWTLAKRRDFANDQQNLLAVSGPENERKGDKDPAQYLPPDNDYDCTYVRDYIAVKVKWDLTVDTAEYTALSRVLAAC
jgi:hypothetical protein